MDRLVEMKDLVNKTLENIENLGLEPKDSLVIATECLKDILAIIDEISEAAQDFDQEFKDILVELGRMSAGELYQAVDEELKFFGVKSNEANEE